MSMGLSTAVTGLGPPVRPAVERGLPGRLAAGLSLPACCAGALLLLSLAGTVDAQEPPPQVLSPTLDEILGPYNAALERTLEAVDSLSVEQTIMEPQGDGSFKTARAVLTYTACDGLEREILECELSYMFGRYTLESLVGPRIDRAEYEVVFEGTEEMDGQECYRLALTALARDSDHFDGTVWVSTECPGPVRVVGEVADPPFPTTEIRLDKAFEFQPCGLWMVRRHTGEVEASLLGRRRGMRHIFYDRYDIRFKREHAPERAVR